ncbi:MAG: hypothetical protein V2A65_04910 [Candidatus Omnitrophota bacterium]
MEVTVINLKEVIYQGNAKSLIVPGESGVFEVLPFHKDIISRLIKGEVVVDGNFLKIKRGVVKVIKNEATVIVEAEE